MAPEIVSFSGSTLNSAHGVTHITFEANVMHRGIVSHLSSFHKFLGTLVLLTYADTINACINDAHFMDSFCFIRKLMHPLLAHLLPNAFEVKHVIEMLY